MKRTTLLILVLAAVSVAAGCRPTRLELPESYVRLAEPGYAHTDRVVSADGVYIGLRRGQRSEDGSLDFWAKAIRNQLAGGKGYVLTGESAITSADGVAGKRLDFTCPINDREFAYTLAVWVHGGQVIVAEAGGPKEAFEADAAKIAGSLSSLKIKP
jgi:hypothetical protein